MLTRENVTLIEPLQTVTLSIEELMTYLDPSPNSVDAQNRAASTAERRGFAVVQC